MATKSTISVYQKSSGVDFKGMIKKLIDYKDHSNPYMSRSESEVVKMLLEVPLEKACQKILPKRVKAND